MNKIKKYFWTTDDEYLNGESTFNTIEECINEARYYWLNGDERFDTQDPDGKAGSVVVTIGETNPVNFRPVVMKMLDNLPNWMESYINDNYGFCEDVDSLGDTEKDKIADFVVPILDRTTGYRFYSKSVHLEHEYEITRENYKKIK